MHPSTVYKHTQTPKDSFAVTFDPDLYVRLISLTVAHVEIQQSLGSSLTQDFSAPYSLGMLSGSWEVKDPRDVFCGTMPDLVLLQKKKVKPRKG